MRDEEPPDWALPSWDALPADPTERGGLRPVGPGILPRPGSDAAGLAAVETGRPGQPTAPGTFGVRILGVYPPCLQGEVYEGHPEWRRIATNTTRPAPLMWVSSLLPATPKAAVCAGQSFGRAGET